MNHHPNDGDIDMVVEVWAEVPAHLDFTGAPETVDLDRLRELLALHKSPMEES